MTAQAAAEQAAQVGPARSVVLQAERLTRRFGGLLAVNSVSFDVEEGEIFGLIGPNGAGKTTLFNMITGLQRLSSGSVRYRGSEISKLRPDQIARRGIARTFQNIRLFGNLSALENVMIAQHVHLRSGVLGGVLGLPLSRREEQHAPERACELLDLVGLLGRAYQEARTLPYGDQRRLEIARALALEPTLLLLDEPAAGMNPNEKHDLSTFIRGLHDRFKLTVLLIEHHVPLVLGLCDRIAVLNFGQLIALGAPEQVRQDPAVIDAYLGAE
ncbi:MAG: ABC transporter ATP-binding protein [Herpetosiphonaceae bacterium]|nr:ABC transporter ATP-binding protein [Herpetosiphonaceae bacterium]